MKKLKIGFFECEGWEKEYIKKAHQHIFKNAEIEFFTETIQDLENKVSFDEYDIISTFIYSSLNKNIIDRLSNCKAIITRSMGYDHISLKDAQKKNIEVYNIYDYGTNTVAEYTLLLILMLLRKMKKILYDYQIHEKILPREWRGEELENKTIGIVGTGNIGIRVIELLSKFNVKILAYSRHKKEDLINKYKIKYVDKLEDLLSLSDIISFHVPLTPQTYHMLNTKNIHHLKDGAYIINTSRGGVIETEAIIEGIKSGKIKGAAMDVFEGEKLERLEMDILMKNRYNIEELKDSLAHQILRYKDNIIITPHIAYNTEEALKRIIDTTIKIINNISSNKLEEIKRYRII